MRCESTQDWLMQCETLRLNTWPRKVARHVRACVSCLEFARSLKRLERAWRNQPLPAGAKQPTSQFLAKITHLEVPPQQPSGKWIRPARWLIAAAACLVVGAAIGSYMILSPQARADDVVEKLIEWNADISNADAKERKQLLEVYEDIFRQRLLKSKLSPEERKIGDLLLKAGRDLAMNDDLVEDEDIITDLAEQLLRRKKAAELIGNLKDSERYNTGYTLFVEKAVNPLQHKLRVIDRLIDWNMEMANADSKKRKQLLEDNEVSLRKDLDNAKLPPEERAMAEKLFEVGRRLALNSDPVKEAEAITEVADKLLVRAETAEKNGKKKESDRYGMGYSVFMEKTVNPFFEKMKTMQSKPPHPDGKKSGADFAMEKKELEKIWERSSQNNRSDLQKRLESLLKKGIQWPPKSGKRPPGGNR